MAVLREKVSILCLSSLFLFQNLKFYVKPMKPTMMKHIVCCVVPVTETSGTGDVCL